MIDKLIDEFGAARIAEAINESVQTVCNWKVRGVPNASVIKFCRAVNWQKTPHQICPEIYPHPDDGLPDHLRSAA